ncbi:MAG TPA: TonB-dependent receptor [Bacteroidales bacterium]|nr:TonB-dependent receptor [Bacteroidales bacterium]HPS17228.1 TonB-dependent receptor [Bacteroidales bacterium]
MKKEKKNQGAKKIFCAICVLLCSNSFAQQNDSIKSKELKPLVVSATRTEKNADSIGRSITVISSKELMNGIYNNVAEVLQTKEGISIVGAGQNPGMAQSIFMRGANSNQTVIMIDGIRITDPSSTNNALNLAELSLSNIDRIEIIRGAHSTMYGSSAIGGVINIITKKNQETGFSGNTEFKAGTFGKQTFSMSENIFGAYSFKNGFYCNLEYLGTNADGLDATIDTVTSQTVYKNRDKDDFSISEINGKIGYSKNKINAYTSFKNLNQLSDLDKSAYTDDDNYYLNFKRQLINYGVSYKINKHLELSFDGGFSEMKRYAEDDSSVVDTMFIDSLGTSIDIFDHTYYDDLYKGSSLTNEAQLNYSVKGFDIVAGGSLFNEKMTSENYYYSKSMWGVYETSSNLDSLNIDVITSGAFMHADIEGSLFSGKLNKLALAVGARYSKHELFGVNKTFEINPIYRVTNNAMLYLSYSTSFNAPSMYQLYAPFVNTTSGIIRGNKNLKPETGKSFEGGIKYFPAKNVSVFASYFHTEVDNSIEYVYLWNKQTPVDSLSFMDYIGDTYLNIGTFYTQGIELGITSDISEKFSLSGNITLLGGKLKYTPSSIDTVKTEGNYVQLYNNGEFIKNKDITILGLTRRPNCANLMLSYNIFKSISLSTNIRYVGSQNDVYYNSELGPFGALGTVGLEDYALMDLSLKYKYNDLIFIAKAENIFDKKYTEINGFTTRGRGLYLSLKYAF